MYFKTHANMKSYIPIMSYTHSNLFHADIITNPIHTASHWTLASYIVWNKKKNTPRLQTEFVIWSCYIPTFKHEGERDEIRIASWNDISRSMPFASLRDSLKSEGDYIWHRPKVIQSVWFEQDISARLQILLSGSILCKKRKGSCVKNRRECWRDRREKNQRGTGYYYFLSQWDIGWFLFSDFIISVLLEEILGAL